MNDSLVAAFRELRDAWFETQLRSHPHEREWESEGAAALRDTNNRELRARYDQQTEDIIEGATEYSRVVPVCPTCAIDMEAPQ